MRKFAFLFVLLFAVGVHQLRAADYDSLLVIMQPIVCASENDTASTTMVSEMSITLMGDSALAEDLFLPSAGITYLDAIVSPVSAPSAIKVKLSGRNLVISTTGEATDIPTTTVYSLTGQTVDSFRALRHSLASLPSGDYLLRISEDGKKAEVYKLKVK